MVEGKYGVAVMGMGAGRGGAQGVSREPRAKLVAVCDIQEERARGAGEALGVPWYTDYIKMLERDDVDIVYIVTPNGLHAEHGIECAKHKKNVIITKPLTVTVEQANELIAACDGESVKLITQYTWRHNPVAHQIKRAIDKGKFGKLILGNQSLKYFRPQKYYDGWRGTWKLGGGATLTIPIHSIDLLQWWMGPVATVYGRMWTFDRQMEAENLSLAILTFKSGAVGNIVATTSFPKNSVLRTEIHGDKGAVIFNCRGAEIELWIGEEEPPPTDIPQSALSEMVDWLAEGKKPMTDGREGRKSVELITAIYESARTGKVVRLG